ncbi:PadR family transcriptional regulator [Planctobacterium marinum]|uniref:PadR family transcriptional regulator n=1 Tax=Planctobacterium marinum TaxID=1631968 RepID=UPI001E32467E|nr:helix-turn-helix transcriptional regulator [Planctobacterium marinum]MCC2604312.1 helix-turn-helix transcriptional regulator [Planctobacterium marinum]
METEQLDKLKQELRRGILVLAVLMQLRQEHYGYSLRKALIENGLDIDEGTLYPLVRRLEKQGLLNSEWREETKRKKRFYWLSEDGVIALQAMQSEWRILNTNIEQILQGVEK